MKSSFLFLVAAVLLLTDCNQPAESDSVSGGGGTIEAINHTHWAINTLVSTGSRASILSAHGKAAAVRVTLVSLQNGNRE